MIEGHAIAGERPKADAFARLGEIRDGLIVTA